MTAALAQRAALEQALRPWEVKKHFFLYRTHACGKRLVSI
jgi:hypothetical protein